MLRQHATGITGDSKDLNRTHGAEMGGQNEEVTVDVYSRGTCVFLLKLLTKIQDSLHRVNQAF